MELLGARLAPAESAFVTLQALQARGLWQPDAPASLVLARYEHRTQRAAAARQRLQTLATSAGLSPATAGEVWVGLAWTDGGEVDTIMTGTFQRKTIRTFGNLATNQIQLNKSGEAAKLIDTVEVYVTDYGKHKLVLNRFMRNEVVLCLDMSRFGHWLPCAR